MTTQESYNNWASQYDTNINNTRDLEGKALRNVLREIPFKSCLEIGCGTGKNTVWFAGKNIQLTSIDLSEEMMALARRKINDEKVEFIQADITGSWTFTNKLYDLVSFSLVLEHIKDLDHIFKETAQSLRQGGYVYIGELHPFKQYTGSKARFETTEGIQVVECFTHHMADFVKAAKKSGLELVELDEYFDNDKRNEIPRILTLLLKKV